MPVTVIPTDNFSKELKRLSKKHRAILSDIADLSVKLKENPALVRISGRIFIRSGSRFPGKIKENREGHEL